jgi:hypothetical protein
MSGPSTQGLVALENSKVEIAQLADALDLCALGAIEVGKDGATMTSSAFAVAAREASRITEAMERALRV